VVVLRPNMGAMMFDQGSGGYGGNGQRRKWSVAGWLCFPEYPGEQPSDNRVERLLR
jgi:hypothetical protein